MMASCRDDVAPLSDVSLAAGSGHPSPWRMVCAIDDILPDTGVCALVEQQQVAIFRIGERQCGGVHKESDDGDDDSGRMVFAIANIDPYAHASVLSRGLVGSLGDRLVVASPLYKHHFDLRTGECLESPVHRVQCFDVRVERGHVWIAI